MEGEKAVELPQFPESRFERLQKAKRKKCPVCKKSRKLFCYECQIILEPDLVPVMDKLPLDTYIIKTSKEKNSKSTAVQAKIVCPSIKMYSYPEETDAITKTISEIGSSALILFPSDDAVPMEEIDVSKYKSAVFIDGTWTSVKAVLTLPGIEKIQKVKIKNYKTCFWRYQNKPDNYLATVEAIYYFYREFLSRKGQDPSQISDLVFIFQYQVWLIQRAYKNNELSRIPGWSQRKFLTTKKDQEDSEGTDNSQK